MKIKRKLYPNSNDKEFVLMSINDLKRFGEEAYHTVMQGKMGPLNPNPNQGIESLMEEGIKYFLKDFNLKTPVSHQKRQRKQKTEENVNENVG
jgi:hypothetical protein